MTNGGTSRKVLDWATSKSIGAVSEIAVLTPIRHGCVPGERRTYEERLTSAIGNLADRHQQGLPTELGRISTIHFGRMIVIRPEQYLLYSDIADIKYYPDDERTSAVGISRVPEPIDDYLEPSREAPPKLRSFLLTLVEFDGDFKVYMRDIAAFLASDFDKVFENCDDYPTTRHFEPFWLWIRRYQINTNLFYAPYSNLSTVRIKQLEEFKRRFDALVARIYSPAGSRVRSVEELFEDFLRQSQQCAGNFPTPGGMFETDKG
jgi:hypothetical protein